MGRILAAPRAAALGRALRGVGVGGARIVAETVVQTLEAGAAFLTTGFGMSEPPAQATVDGFFADPAAGIERRKEANAASANSEAVLAELATTMDELHGYLAGVEATEQVLADS